PSTPPPPPPPSACAPSTTSTATPQPPASPCPRRCGHTAPQIAHHRTATHPEHNLIRDVSATDLSLQHLGVLPQKSFTISGLLGKRAGLTGRVCGCRWRIADGDKREDRVGDGA